jgi:hypothetical protein
MALKRSAWLAPISQADLIDELHASIDGLPGPNLFAHRGVSPDFMFVAAPNNALGLSPGDSGIAVADGYWAMLAPIPVGETHVLNFGAASPNSASRWRDREGDVLARAKFTGIVRSRLGWCGHRFSLEEGEGEPQAESGLRIARVGKKANEAH